MPDFSYASETLHIALISLPQKDVNNQIEGLEKHFYEDYKGKISSYTSDISTEESHLYKPLKYFLFGSYDIALISLVDNYKFSQKQLSPVHQKTERLLEPGLFQVITGSCPLINPKFDIRRFFASKINDRAESFICISSLKLNNKLLLGNGAKFLEPVEEYIKLVLDDVFGVKEGEESNQFFLQQTNTWFELTLLIFSDDIKKIVKSLTTLRKTSLNTLVKKIPSISKEELLNHSLYEYMVKGNEMRVFNPHIFADTHSYFGVNADFEKRPELSKVKLPTQVEWQIKPGHLPELLAILNKLELFGKPVFKTESSFLLTGRSDYLITEQSDNLGNNLKLFTLLKQNDKLFRYVRRVKTKVMFNYLAKPVTRSKHNERHPHFKEIMQKLFLDERYEPARINDSLKRLKISRNVRNKITKVYQHYYNGILNPILFTYILDFVTFIENLTKIIEIEVRLMDDFFAARFDEKANYSRTIHSLENKLLQNVEIFEKAYSTRMLNGYHFEDINDFDLDFNSSIQQLLSIYNTLASDISDMYYLEGTHAPVVQMHLKRTVSNYDSINYDVYHLTSPEFVFFTLYKEVLNKFVMANDEDVQRKNSLPDESKTDGKEIISVRKSCIGLAKLAESCPRLSKFKHFLDFERYFLDAVVLIQACNCDFDLFKYWFWSYNFQTSSMYDTTGNFNEDHFQKELLRLFFCARLFKIEIKTISCPLPELAYLWERHSYDIELAVNEVFYTIGSGDMPNGHPLRYFKTAIVSIFGLSSEVDLDKHIWAQPSEDEKLEERIIKIVGDHVKPFLHNGPKLLDCLETIKGFVRYNIQMEGTYNKTLKDGKAVYCLTTEAKEQKFISGFIYQYLRLIYTENKMTIRLLRRSWENGDPLTSFIKSDKSDFLYNIDQLGGIFFTKTGKSNEYFKIRNAALQTLWHYAHLCKKKLYFKKTSLNEG